MRIDLQDFSEYFLRFINLFCMQKTPGQSIYRIRIQWLCVSEAVKKISRFGIFALMKTFPCEIQGLCIFQRHPQKKATIAGELNRQRKYWTRFGAWGNNFPAQSALVSGLPHFQQLLYLGRAKNLPQLFFCKLTSLLCQMYEPLPLMSFIGIRGKPFGMFKTFQSLLVIL